MASYASGRLTRSDADSIISSLRPLLDRCSAEWYVCGSYRREKTDMGDLDFLLVKGNMPVVRQELGKYIDVVKWARSGDILSTVVVKFQNKELQLEFSRTEPQYLGAALLHHTGSNHFNVEMRSYANNKGFSLSQYGLKEIKTSKNVSSLTEQDIFNALGLKFIEPKKRESFYHIKEQYKL